MDQSLEVRKLGDSQLSLQKKREGGRTESTWQSREDYLRSLAGRNVFVAPRRYEGIGMAFLEAMAMGMCVVAENQSTANEYILSGENGILYGGGRARLFAPAPASLCELERMGKAARESIGQIHRNWLETQGEVSERVRSLLGKPVKRRLAATGLLEATLDFSRKPEKFWALAASISPSEKIWRSEKIEKRARSRRGLLGGLRHFLRNPRKSLVDWLAQ